MRFLLDENVESQIASELTNRAHDVETVTFDHERSLADSDVLTLAISLDRILVTNDTGFGDLVFSSRRAHRGVILFRLRRMTAQSKAARLLAALEMFVDARPFVVIDARGIRAR